MPTFLQRWLMLCCYLTFLHYQAFPATQWLDKLQTAVGQTNDAATVQPAVKTIAENAARTAYNEVAQVQGGFNTAFDNIAGLIDANPGNIALQDAYYQLLSTAQTTLSVAERNTDVNTFLRPRRARIANLTAPAIAALTAERNTARADLAARTTDLATRTIERDAARTDRDNAQRDLAAAQTNNNGLLGQIATLGATVTNITTERNTHQQNLTQAHQQIANLQQQLTIVTTERDARPTQQQLAAETAAKQQAEQERDARPTQQALDQIQQQLNTVTAERDARPTQQQLAAETAAKQQAEQERDARPTQQALDQLQQQLNTVTADRDARPTQQAFDQVQQQLTTETAAKQQAEQERDARPTQQALDQLQQQLNTVTADRDARPTQQAFDQVQQQLTTETAAKQQALADKATAEAAKAAADQEKTDAQAARDSALADLANAQATSSGLQGQIAALGATVTNIAAEQQNLTQANQQIAALQQQLDARPTQQQLAAEAAAKQQALDAKAAAEQQAQQLQQQLAAETAAKQQTLADKVTAEKRATDAEAAQQQAEQEKANAEKHNIRVSAEVTKVLKQIEMERDEHTVNLWKDKINTIAEYSKADEMPTAAKDYLTRRQNEYRVQLNKASARLEKTKAEYLQLARKKPAKWESFKNLCLYYSSKKDPFDLEPLKQELKKGDATQLKATLLHVDEKNRNLLHFAAGWGHKKSDQLYNLELSNWTSYWPICGSSLVETPVSVLTEKAKELGIDLSGYVDQQDAFGNTPLHYAIMAKSFDTISDFEGIASAEKVSIGWDAKNKEGKSPSGLIIDNETNPDSESFYDPSIPLSTIAINQLSDKNIQETIIKKLADKLSPETIKMLSQQTQQAIIQARENKFEPVGSFTGIAVSLRNALRKQTIKGIVRTTMQSTGKKAKDILTPLPLEIKNIIINIYKDPNIYIDRDSYLKTMESLSEHYKQTQPTTTSSSSSKPLQWEAIKSACLSENLAGIDLTNKNIDFLMYTDGNGRNLLHFAAGGRRQEWQEGYVSIDNLYDINLCNKKPVTFWFYPMVDNTPIRRTPVNILIKKAQDLNLDINTYVNKQDALHNTPLHYAIMAKHMSTILDLQNSKQVRWDIKNNNDETPEDLFINNEKSSYAHSFYDPQRFTTYTNINKFMEAEVQGKVITSIYEKFTNLTKKALSSRIQNAITQAFNKQFKSDLHFGDIREALINILRVQILTEEEKKLPAQEIVTLPQDVQAVIKQAQQQPTSIIDRALYIKARKAMLQLSKLHQKTSQSSSSNT